MKTFILVTLLLSLTAAAQENESCCSAPARFASLASDVSFRAAHLEPMPFTFISEKGKFVSFKTPDGKEGRAFEVKSEKATNKYIFMIHEWWGLNDYIQQEAEKLQKELGNVNVLALDLYDSKVAATRDDAAKYVRAVKEERAGAIIQGAFEYVGPEAKVGTIGWCFGGGWSMQAALIGGKQVSACVIYYGMPEADPEKLKSLNAPVLGIFGKQDASINEKVVKEFEHLMKKGKKKLSVKWYDAVHAFANPSNPKHDKAAAEDAYKLTVNFFKNNLLK